MQNAKDSFYEVLRGRLSSLNPDRTVVVRGVTRAAVLVDENEMPGSAAVPDAFHLQWAQAYVVHEGALAMVTLRCAITYSTAGSAWNGGLDRGRILAAMDGELLAAVGMQPQNAAKKNYAPLAQGAAALAMPSALWWSDVSFGAVKAEAERLVRTAEVQVMAYQDAGEM